MERINAKSKNAGSALALVEELQMRFVRALEAVSGNAGHELMFAPIEWLRDDGRHGGGIRYVAVETPVFNRAAVNVSGVHYDDDPDKRLASATAISTIIHPRHPRAPSVHMHISWTEMRDGTGYWRIMADLNPSIPDDDDTVAFERALRQAAPSVYEHARTQGARYFEIPALGRHRGVSHFYLEGYSSGDFAADFEFARTVGEATIDCYAGLLASALERHDAPSDDERARQLAYHTAYFFQVLTLDRGTTSGLLVHDQNDVGILGSLPAFIDRELLASWAEKVASPQDLLVRALVARIPEDRPSHVSEEVRAELAQVVRVHYRTHPQALSMQAAADIIPPTVENHS